MTSGFQKITTLWRELSDEDGVTLLAEMLKLGEDQDRNITAVKTMEHVAQE